MSVEKYVLVIMDDERNTLGLEFDDDPKVLADMCEMCKKKYPGADMFRVLPVESLGMLLDFALSKAGAIDDNGRKMSPMRTPTRSVDAMGNPKPEAIERYRKLLEDKKTSPEKMGMAIAIFFNSFWEHVHDQSKRRKIDTIDVTLKFLAEVHVGLRDYTGNRAEQQRVVSEKKEAFESYLGCSIDSDAFKKVLSETMPSAQIAIDASHEIGLDDSNDVKAVKFGLEQLLNKVSQSLS